jgi:thiol-disulfide isomerase/thioredoxin
MLRRLSAIAVFALALLSGSLRAEDFKSHFVTSNPPQLMPDFVFTDGSGKSLNLADFRGQAVVLNLWASWCGPCVEEMPSLDALQGQFAGKNLTVIALDEDRNADLAPVFFKRHEIKNLQVYNDAAGHGASALHARGLPTTILIRADGKEIGFMEGAADWSSPEIAAFLRSHLIEP